MERDQKFEVKRAFKLFDLITTQRQYTQIEEAIHRGINHLTSTDRIDYESIKSAVLERLEHEERRVEITSFEELRVQAYWTARTQTMRVLTSRQREREALDQFREMHDMLHDQELNDPYHLLTYSEGTPPEADYRTTLLQMGRAAVNDSLFDQDERPLSPRQKDVVRAAFDMADEYRSSDHYDPTLESGFYEEIGRRTGMTRGASKEHFRRAHIKVINCRAFKTFRSSLGWSR